VTLVNYKKRYLENELQYYENSATLHVAVFFISGKNSITLLEVWRDATKSADRCHILE
jgi:hypothetical protein